ncbi:MAG: hypothetical protein CVU42_04845 [Chloroflexi bacterium HGW-Chloroflexi-4]|jgi:hypothetical protein|nr:MAG: hypothetical protein CVU42_04845 [Chloroflexi bacterium HGW-Chloroflexi-4]
MAYPLSSQVTAGQPTAAEHYNNLRKDALNLGQADADAVKLGEFFRRFSSGVKLEYLANHRVRVPYSFAAPPSLMINGCMLQSDSNVDLPVGLISGPAAMWYIFAVRTEGSTSFTLTVNTSSSEGSNHRLIGQAYWTGSALISIYVIWRHPLCRWRIMIRAGLPAHLIPFTQNLMDWVPLHG